MNGRDSVTACVFWGTLWCQSVFMGPASACTGSRATPLCCYTGLIYSLIQLRAKTWVASTPILRSSQFVGRAPFWTRLEVVLPMERSPPSGPGGQKCGIFLKSRGGKRHFVVSLSGLSGLHPALPPMAESLGVPFPAIFGGEIIENGYITILT